MDDRYKKIIANVQTLVNKQTPLDTVTAYLKYEGLTPKQFKSLVEGPTVVEQIKGGLKAIPYGAIGALESGAIGASALLPEEAEKATREYIKEKAAAARAPFAAQPGAENLVSRELMEGVGSVIPYAVAGFPGLLGRAAVVGLSGAQGAGTARTRAEEAGATSAERSQATGLGTVVGLTQLIPVFSFFNRLGKDVQSGILAGIQRAFTTGGMESAQEAAAQYAQNLIAKGIYKPEQEAIEGTGEAGAYGFGVGALIQGLTDLALGRRGSSAGKAPPSGAPEAPTTPEVPVTPPQGEFQETADLPTREITPEGPAPAEVQRVLDMRVPVEEELRARESGAAPQPVEVNGTSLITDEELQAAYEGLTTRATANLEAAPKETPTVLEPEVLDSTGLTKQSGIYKQLVGKDLQNLEDLDAVMQIVERARENKSLPKSTKQALETIATNAFNIYGRQAEMFGPRGGVLPTAEQRIAKPTPVQKKIASIVEGKDLTDPVQIEQVRESLTDYANAPTRSQSAITQIDEFLQTLPPSIPEATDVIQPTEPVAPAVEPSPAMAGERGEVPAGRIEEPVPTGLDAAPAVAGEPDVGAGVQPTALAAEETPIEQAAAFIKNLKSKKIVPLTATSEIAANEPDLETDKVTSIVARRQDRVDNEEDIADEIEYKKLQESARRELIAEYDRQIKAVWPVIQRAKKVLSTTKFPNSLEAGAVDFSTNQLENLVSQYQALIEGGDFNSVRSRFEESFALLPKDLERLQDSIDALEKPSKPTKGKSSTKKIPKTTPEPLEGRLELRDAIDALVKGGVSRASATEFVNENSDSFGTIGPAYVDAALRKVSGKAKYREGAPGEGIPQSRVQKIVDGIQARWKNAPKTQVVQDIQELPQELYQQMVRDNAMDAPGVYDPNTETVHLIADNITSDKEAVLTLLHESFGHFGIQSVLGNTYGKVMEDVFNGNAKVRELAKKKMEGGLDKNTAVEEVLAEMAEKGVYNNAMQRVFNAIRQFLRSLGRLGGFEMGKVTDNEIRALLANAQRFVVGKGVKREGAKAFANKPLYRTKPTLTPEGEKAAALNERMKGISNPAEDGAATVGKGLAGVHHFFTRKDGPSWWTRVRQAVADKDASANEKLEAKFNNTLIDAMGNVRADLMVDQAQDAASLAENVLDGGGIEINKAGLVETYTRKDGVSMKKVFEIISDKLGKKLGSVDLAFQVAHNALIANRAKEINIHNAKVQKDIDAALAKKNTKAAEALEKTKITIRASQEEIDAGLEAMETYPEIKEALKVFTEYKNGLVDFLQATGRINAETARNWKENAGYVPWTRVEKEVDLLEENPISYKTGLINLSQLPKLDREGSTKEIANVFDNMIGLTNWAVKTGLKTRAASGMAEQLDDVVELKTDAALKREQKNNPGRVIYTYKNGERTAYLVGSVLDIPVFSTNIEVLGPMMKAFKAVGDFQRGAITHMPAFALSQLIQDGTYRAALLSGVEKPFQLSLRVFKNFGKALRGDLSEIAALGVTGVYDGMPDQMMERARVRYGLKERGAAKKAWDKLEKFSLAADLAVRSAIYEQTMQETNGDQRLALYRAKEYINFKRAGASPTIRTLRHVVPFMNAYIQGTDVLLRTMRGKGVSLQEKRKAQQLFLATGLKLAALNAMYTMLVSGDDEYEGLEEYERDKNYIIPGTGVKIPVAPEVGFLFKVIPERLLRYIVSQGTERPQDAETFYTGFRDAFVTAYGGVNITPQLIKPALEVMVNYSFFTSNPIVGRGMSEEAQFQFNSGTSELAKLFGNIGISPLKADYLIRGYTGMAGAIVLDMVDAVADPDRATKPIFKTPQISTFMYDPTGRGYKSDFYRFRESVDKVVDTVNMFKREGRDEELEEYLTEDRLKLYAMKGVTAKVLNTLSNLRKQRNIIANDKELSGAEKRELVDELLAEEKEILLEYNIPQLRKEMEE